MTVFEIDERYIYEKDGQPIEFGLVNGAMGTALNVQFGHSMNGHDYCKKTYCLWPLDRKLFNIDYFGQCYKEKYGTFENYLNSDDYRVVYKQGDDNGMCQIYYLLDNFSSYYGIFSKRDYLVVLSVGSSYTSVEDGKTFYYNDRLSFGFGVVVNILTNSVTLIALGEDDGNYWAEEEVPYHKLCNRDRNAVLSMVNDIDDSKFWNKDGLIRKLFYGN